MMCSVALKWGVGCGGEGGCVVGQLRRECVSRVRLCGYVRLCSECLARYPVELARQKAYTSVCN